PASRTQARMDVIAVFATLARDDGVARFEGSDVVRIFQERSGSPDFRRGASRIRGAEKHGLEQIEILLGGHALHEHRTDHATPTDKSNLHDSPDEMPVLEWCAAVRGNDSFPYRSAATTASPIAPVPTVRSPDAAISAVRN